MKRMAAWTAAGVFAALCFVGCASAANASVAGPAGHISALAGTWGNAEEVPGLGALNSGGAAQINSVSCGSAGNCSAGGNYVSSSGLQAFVADQVNGSWGPAKEVPGTATLNAGGVAEVVSVSCASAGNCSAGGYYKDVSNSTQAFVVSEVNGTWGKAAEVPGTATLNQGGSAQVQDVSCGSAGNCSVGGYYTNGLDLRQALVASEVNGVWGKAAEVPGTAALNKGNFAYVQAVSCHSAGNCSAGGSYTDASSTSRGFVVSQVNGVWGKAEELPGGTLSHPNASVYSLSCGSAGNCSAGGEYFARGGVQAFVISQVNGVWGKLEAVPGIGALSKYSTAAVNSVSCRSAGNCSAGGNYNDSSNNVQAFVVSQVNGVWGKAEEVPGTATLNKYGNAQVEAVSCGSVGNCSAGGYYADGLRSVQAFVVSQVNGVWGTAEEVPGSAPLDQGGAASITSMSCRSVGHCSAGGYYTDKSQHGQAFVVSET